MHYSYKNLYGKTININLDDKSQAKVNQAIKDYETSKRHIVNQQFYHWRAALSSYHLSTYNRKVQLGSDTWKQNITIGLVRSFVDILTSSLNEKPLSFIGTAINKKGYENKENIIKTLNYISDVSGFHKEIKETMKNGLIVGEISMRIGYMKSEEKNKYISIVDGAGVEEEIEEDEKDYPYAVNVPVFNIFPDPYTGRLRYVTERGVVSIQEFTSVFGSFIENEDNTSPFKGMYKFLPLNDNGADFDDYGSIVNQVHEKANDEFRQSDYFEKPKNMTASTTSTNIDEDSDVTEGLIEFKITWYDGRVILIANNYPVYIGPNPYGFIPYVIKASSHTRTRFGEGVGYMIKPLEDIGNSFLSNYFDSARAISNPTLVVQKNLMIDDEQLEDGTPGGVVYTEDNLSGNAVYRLDKGGLSDFNVMALINQIAYQIIGISEYDMGQSAKERTAAGALAVTQSSQKRMSPYVSNFLEAISIVAQMWLKLVKKYWSSEKMIYILDEEGKQTWENIKNTGLFGGVNISLEAEGMFGVNEELKHKKLIELYNVLGPSGFFESPEMGKEIIKTAGYSPSKFITEPGEGTKPDNAEQITANMNQTGLPGKNDSPAEELGEIVRDAVTPNTDLGNGGKGR